MEQVGFEGLIGFAVESISPILAELAGEWTSLVTTISDALAAGDAEIVKDAVTVSAFPHAPDPTLLLDLRDALSGLAGAIHGARSQYLTATELSRLAEHLRRVGESLLAHHAEPMAYNLFECSYHVSAFIHEPALPTAKRLRELSDPANADQFAVAVWSLATEQLRYSLASGSEWIEAVDAVELALTIVPESPEVQQQVYARLEAVLPAPDTPIAELTAIVAVQAPPAAMPAARRDQFIRAVLGRSSFAAPAAAVPEAASEAMRYLAVVSAQAMVEDLRLRLLGTPNIRTSLTWLDRSLHHRQLSSAVPLGKALVADIERTSLFALELVHEIGHAYALGGPIGWATTALRVSVHCLELMLIGELGEVRDDEPLVPAQRISKEPNIVALAGRQLAIAYRAGVARATWTTWLEGVSLYLELLCDPADDSNEINAVHAAVRSLVDYHPEASRDDPLVDSEKWTAQFEAFCSEALRRNSRLRHFAYATDENAAIYLSGYLLVRSIVSRWETTLGRRIAPAVAVKLLLGATRTGAAEAVMDLDAPLQQCLNRSRDRFFSWVQTLANLERDVLERFFEPVGKLERGRSFGWRNGRPFVEEVPDTESSIAEAYARAQKAAIRLAWPAGNIADGPSLDEAQYAGEFGRHVAARFDSACMIASLLPVGRDYVRALLFDNMGRLAVCPRTYAGVQGAGEDLSIPRYSIGSWVLPNGTDDVRRLRRLLTIQGSSRLLATRIIDFAGHSTTMNGMQNISYVCFYLPGTDWIHLSLGYLAENIADKEERLRALVVNRIHPTPFLRDESDTIGSLEFLVRRMHDAGAEWALASFAAEFSERHTAEQTGFAALAAALGTSVDRLVSAIGQVLDSHDACSRVATYLFRTGVRRETAEPPEGAATFLSALAFDSNAVSGIHPHRVPSE